jgi:dihydrodipicolinate synthase/N-acetylneuraminate lyase
MKDLGIVVPVVTPCSLEGEPDLDGLRSVCGDLLAAGASSIFVGGSSGRGPWFSRDDRVRICRTAADVVSDSQILLAGCMASGLPQMLENAHAMADAGADLVVVTAPGYFNYSQDELETVFIKFADASPLPVVVYDIPDLARIKLDVEVGISVAHHEKIVGFKDSTSDYPHFKALLDGLADLTDFYLLQGKERFLMDSLLAGASGFVVSMVQIDPQPFVRLYRAVRGGDLKVARRLQTEIIKMMDLFEESFRRRPESSTFFHLLNWALRYRGAADNILLEHEGECPDWLAANAQRAADICAAAAEIEG